MSVLRTAFLISVSLAISVTSIQKAVADTYTEDFNGYSDPTSITDIGWTIAHDTNASQVTAGPFATNDDQNIARVTNVSDGYSTFSSGYFYYEHDISVSQGETTRAGTFFGQDAGDYLMTTAAPKGFGTGVNLLGSRFQVDYQMGPMQFSSKPGFQFAVVLENGSAWVTGDAIHSFNTTGIEHETSDPISTGMDFKRLFISNNAGPGQRILRSSETTFLSASQLQTVQRVGLYVNPLGELSPSRFDNFQLMGFELVGVPEPHSCVAIGWVLIASGIRRKRIR